MTNDQKKQALNNAIDNYNHRVEQADKLRPNSLSAIGNDKCIRRLDGAIEEMENDTASSRRWNYWLKQGK